MSLNVMSTRFLNTSRDGDSTTAQGSTFQNATPAWQEGSPWNPCGVVLCPTMLEAKFCFSPASADTQWDRVQLIAAGLGLPTLSLGDLPLVLKPNILLGTHVPLSHTLLPFRLAPSQSSYSWPCLPKWVLAGCRMPNDHSSSAHTSI